MRDILTMTEHEVRIPLSKPNLECYWFFLVIDKLLVWQKQYERLQKSSWPNQEQNDLELWNVYITPYIYSTV